MTAHNHAEMIKAKADNMDLVLFRKTPTSEAWEVCRNDWVPADSQDKYFLCLPQHKEACLHWLNGRDLVVNYGVSIWEDFLGMIRGNNAATSENNCFLRVGYEFAVKPRKEKRWIGVNMESVTDVHYLTEKACADSVEHPEDWQFIEIEVEV